MSLNVQAAFATLFLSTSASALAFECLTMADMPDIDGQLQNPLCPSDVCKIFPGDAAEFTFRSGDFTAAEKTEITKGATMWNAGDDFVNRGATWEFVPAGDTSVQSFEDDLTTVLFEDDAFFTAHGAPTALAFAVHEFRAWPDCRIRSADVVLNSDLNWKHKRPNALPNINTTFSLRQTVAHEFGHVLGLGHVQGLIATMNNNYPFGGDLANHDRVNADEYAALLAYKPGPSTGINLLLSKFDVTNAQIGASDEFWTGRSGAPEWPWEACPGHTLPVDKSPHHIYAISQSSVQLVSGVVVRWKMRKKEDGNCLSPQSIDLGSVGVNLPSGVAVPVNLEGWTVPIDAEPGKYRVCAQIDAPNQFAETSELDNKLLADKRFTVLDPEECE